MSMFTQYFPYRVREGSLEDAREAYADRCFAILDEYAPNFQRAVIARQVLAPQDIETRFGLTGGNIFQGAMTLDQLFCLRPLPGYADYRTPVRGSTCGAATHQRWRHERVRLQRGARDPARPGTSAGRQPCLRAAGTSAGRCVTRVEAPCETAPTRLWNLLLPRSPIFPENPNLLKSPISPVPLTLGKRLLLLTTLSRRSQTLPPVISVLLNFVATLCWSKRLTAPRKPRVGTNWPSTSRVCTARGSAHPIACSGPGWHACVAARRPGVCPAAHRHRLAAEAMPRLLAASQPAGHAWSTRPHQRGAGSHSSLSRAESHVGFAADRWRAL